MFDARVVRRFARLIQQEGESIDFIDDFRLGELYARAEIQAERSRKRFNKPDGKEMYVPVSNAGHTFQLYQAGLLSRRCVEWALEE